MHDGPPQKHLGAAPHTCFYLYSILYCGAALAAHQLAQCCKRVT